MIPDPGSIVLLDCMLECQYLNVAGTVKSLLRLVDNLSIEEWG